MAPISAVGAGPAGGGPGGGMTPISAAGAGPAGAGPGGGMTPISAAGAGPAGGGPGGGEGGGRGPGGGMAPISAAGAGPAGADPGGGMAPISAACAGPAGGGPAGGGPAGDVAADRSLGCGAAAPHEAQNRSPGVVATPQFEQNIWLPTALCFQGFSREISRLQLRLIGDIRSRQRTKSVGASTCRSPGPRDPRLGPLEDAGG